MSRGSIFPAGNGVFAYDCFDSTRACTYDQLRTLLNDDLGGVDAETRVAIAMRNGADLALALLRVMHWAIAVPLCPNSSPAELRAAMEGCAYCVVDATDGPAALAAAAAGAAVVLAAPKEGEAGATFRLSAPEAVWKSTSESGYPENYWGDLREPPRHRAAVAVGATSRRWRGASQI